MCLSFSYLLWLLSEALGSMKLAKFQNDECTLVPPPGEETNLISVERGGWYWKSSGILPGTILEIFILIAWMNWMCSSDKSTLPPRELCKWSITDLFVCLLHVCVCVCVRLSALKSFSYSPCAVVDCLCTQAKTLFTVLTYHINETLDKIFHPHITTYQILIRGTFFKILVTTWRNGRQQISIENHIYFS